MLIESEKESTYLDVEQEQENDNEGTEVNRPLSTQERKATREHNVQLNCISLF
jgi:hypothetical protein